MSEWQPIETAPKDGTPVWGRAPSWRPGKYLCGWVYWGDEQFGPGWVTAGFPGGVVGVSEWMPLPKPPETA